MKVGGRCLVTGIGGYSSTHTALCEMGSIPL